MQTDSIIALAIAYAIQKRPELVQADILKLMRQKASLKLKTRNCGAWWAGSRWPGLGMTDVGENRASAPRTSATEAAKQLGAGQPHPRCRFGPETA